MLGGDGREAAQPSLPLSASLPQGAGPPPRPSMQGSKGFAMEKQNHTPRKPPQHHQTQQQAAPANGQQVNSQSEWPPAGGEGRGRGSSWTGPPQGRRLCSGTDPKAHLCSRSWLCPGLPGAGGEAQCSLRLFPFASHPDKKHGRQIGNWFLPGRVSLLFVNPA